MSTTTAEATFTEFLRNPNLVTDQLREGDVILHRRNEEDLRLTVESRVSATEESLGIMGRVFTDALADKAIRSRLTQRVALPWLKFLPKRARESFYTDLFECAEAVAQLGTIAPLARLIDEWRATAAVYADPDLASRLTQPLDEDQGTVRRPTVRAAVEAAAE
jgi:hypothetical protein